MTRLRALAAVLAVMAVSLPVLASPATATPTPLVGDEHIRLIDQPIAVEPSGRFPVLLAVTGAPDATDIAVDIYDRAQPGDVIGMVPDRDPDVTFPVVPLGSANSDGTQTVGFTIVLSTANEPKADPSWGHRLTEPGVYPVRVRLRNPDGDTGTVLMTSLIRLPEPNQQVTPVRTALLVGVHAPPPAAAQDRASTDSADPTLLAQLGPTLAALAERPDLPATLSVTPDTLARIAGDPGATADLEDLRDVLAPDSRDLLDAPYVHVDPASLVAADLPAELSRQRDLGRQTLRDWLKEPVVGTWQLQDRVSVPSLASLRSRGIYRILLGGDAIASGAGVFAPVDLPAGDGQVRAMAVSDFYALGNVAPDDPTLAAHQLLARLAVAGEGPTGDPAVVATIDPARADETSLRIVLDALSVGTPFFVSSSLNAVLDSRPDPTDATLAVATPDPLGVYPADMRRSNASLSSYNSLVGDRNDLALPYATTLAVSAAEDLPLEQRRIDAVSVDSDLQAPFSAISIPAKDKVTLGTRDASFPLPIESDLTYPAQVVIQLESNDRLEFPRNRIEETLTGPRTVVNIKVRTRAVGDTPVRITVRTPDDGVILAESQYTIRSTAVSGVGVILTVGAALFLVLWWGRHWHRNRDTARHTRGRKRRSPSDTLV